MFPKHEYLKTSLYMYETNQRVKSFPMRFHKHLEFSYVYEGNLMVTIDGVEYTLNQGDLYLVFPNSSHSIQEGSASALFALVDPEYLRPYQDLLSHHRPTIPVIRKEEMPEGIPMLIRHLIKAYSSDKLWKNAICTGYLNSLLGELLGVCKTEKRDANSELVQELAIYFMDHFSKDITLDLVAKDLNYSKYYISHIVSNTFHCNFRTLINTYRVGMAQGLLFNTSKSIGDIADLCGFKNQSSFNRVFTKHIGITPGEFRKQNAKPQEVSDSILQ